MRFARKSSLGIITEDFEDNKGLKLSIYVQDVIKLPMLIVDP